MKKYDLYVTVEPSEGLDDFSYAQDFLLKKAESRDLRKLALDYGVHHGELYRMATGARSPGYYVILKLKNIIPPVWWFTSISENKPRAKKDNTDYGERLTYKDSQGYNEFFKFSLDEWVNAGINIQYIRKFMLDKVKILTYVKIMELSVKIKPEKWFIF